MESSHCQYVGGTIYADHASGFVMTCHQSSLDAADTLWSKQEFEQVLWAYGHSVHCYHTDNGIFKSRDIGDDNELNELLPTFSSIGAHHQNSVTENAVQTIMERAWAMMLHAAIHWPNALCTELWRMAVTYSTFLWDYTPCSNNCLTPLEVLSSSTMDYGIICSACIWG